MYKFQILSVIIVNSHNSKYQIKEMAKYKQITFLKIQYEFLNI